MSLLNKLNIKPTKTITKTGAKTLEKQINEVFKNACLDAIKSHPEFKKYLVNIKKTDVFKQVNKSDGSKVVELESLEGEIIAIPTEDVELTNGTNKEKLDTAYKVGTIQTYIDGITKKYVEYIKVKK
jgi:hypothetical protein